MQEADRGRGAEGRTTVLTPLPPSMQRLRPQERERSRAGPPTTAATPSTSGRRKEGGRREGGTGRSPPCTHSTTTTTTRRLVAAAWVERERHPPGPRARRSLPLPLTQTHPGGCARVEKQHSPRGEA